MAAPMILWVSSTSEGKCMKRKITTELAEASRDNGGIQSKSETTESERLGDGDFFVGAEDGAHGFADFAEGGVGFYGVVDERHEVLGAVRGLAKGVEAALDFGGRAFGAQLAQALGLAMGDSFVDLQQVHRFFRRYVVVYSDDDFFFFVDRHLVA